MEAEALGEALDIMIRLNIHIQNPCIQVTATQEKLAYIPCFPRNEEAAVAFDNYIGAMEDLAMKHSVYMEKLWQVMQITTTHNATLTVMNNVFIPPIQVTVTSRDHTETTEGKPIQELAAALPHPRPAVITTKLYREYSGISCFTKFCASEGNWWTTSDSSRVCNSLPV